MARASGKDKALSIHAKASYRFTMKTVSQTAPIEPEKLKPVLHLKIERMNGQQLSLLNHVLLQLEAEELAERLGTAFDQDHSQDKLRRIPELVRQFCDGHRYI